MVLREKSQELEPDMGVYLGGIIGLVGGLLALFAVIPKVLEK
jgi:hypothetical protein